MDKDSVKPVLEALIFASDAPVSLDRLASAVEGAERSVVRQAVTELVDDYGVRGGGLFIDEVAGGYQFRTGVEFAPYIRKLFKIAAQKISKPAMESLAVVAYRQPVTRAEIEEVRGVDSGGVLATLMDKRFIKIVGRKEAPGRPVVYGTTKEFLEAFDLKDLSCLPSLKDFQKMEEEDAPAREGSEDNGQGGGDLPPEGRGDDSGGQGQGEPEGRGDRDQGRP